MEYVFAVVGFAGVVGTSWEIFRGGRWSVIALLVASLGFSVLAAVLWTKNRDLQDARKAAADVLKTLPSSAGNFEILSDGQLQGVVLATIGFLEAPRPVRRVDRTS